METEPINQKDPLMIRGNGAEDDDDHRNNNQGSGSLCMCLSQDVDRRAGVSIFR
jgi:hypothetical protein